MVGTAVILISTLTVPSYCLIKVLFNYLKIERSFNLINIPLMAKLFPTADQILSCTQNYIVTINASYRQRNVVYNTNHNEAIKQPSLSFDENQAK